MKRLLAFLLLAPALLSGQVPLGHFPTVPIVQTAYSSPYPSGCSYTYTEIPLVGSPPGGCVATNQPITSGNTAVVCSQWFTGAGNVVTVSDSNSRVPWAQLLAGVTGSSGEELACYGGVATSSGDTIIHFAVTGSSYQLMKYWELPPNTCSLTLDGTPSTSFFSGSPSSVTSPSVTTTQNGSCLFTLIAGNHNSSNESITSTGWLEVTFQQGADTLGAGFTFAGVPGSYSATWSNNSDVGAVSMLALKAPALAITSPSTAPAGSLTNVYDWCLTAQGGVSSYTWSVAGGSLQAGLSLNSSTGCITGTPTVSSANSITFQVTDGTSTVTKGIGLSVGATVKTISFVQYKDVACCVGALTFTSNVTAGDFVGAFVGVTISSGFLAGTVQSCRDSLGTQFSTVMLFQSYVPAYPSTGNAEILGGFAPSSGADTVSCGAGGVSGAPSELSSILELTNVGSLMADNGLNTLGATSSPSTITSGTFTPLVPGEVALALAAGWLEASTYTPLSPLVNISTSNGQQSAGYQILTTVTGYTFSFTQTLNSSDPWQIAVAGLRPAAGAVSVSAGTQLGIFVTGP